MAKRALAVFVLAAGIGVLRGADCTRTSVGKTPLNDLGEGRYEGEQGGLYPGGSNARPASHDEDLDRVGRVKLLDADGNPDPHSGRIVLLSIGMSNTTQEFQVFKQRADADRSKNARVIIVDGAQGGQDAATIADPDAPYWDTVDQKLLQAGVTPLQVESVWLKEARARPTEPFPEDARLLQEDLRSIVRIVKSRYPNTRSVYMSSRTYGGYATTELNPEPYAYQSGFSVKWLVQDQLDGRADVNFDPARGEVLAPWLSWAAYLWADGLTPRSDGLVWRCEDFQDDGTHPSPSGRDKVADMLLGFFKSDPTTVPWFVDCDPSSPGVFGAPPEVRELRASRTVGESVELSWDSLDPVAGAATLYDVLRGTISELRADGGFARAECLAASLPDTPFADSEPGPANDGFWYLVRGRNTCGEGTYGDGSGSPDPRQPLDAGSVACP